MTVIGRPRQFDRDTALAAAMLVFWRKGFAAASMPDLCAAMGIRSPSLYAAFGSKEKLYLEAIHHYVRTMGPPVWGSLERGQTARLGVEAFLLSGAASLPASDQEPAGCMAMLAAIGDEWPVSLMNLAKQVRCECLVHLRSRLDIAIAQGELPASVDIDRLSRFYLGVFQGMAIQAKDGATSAELRGIAEMAMAAWPARSE